ncbi:uncharacterized protein LOC114661931 isoform X2 [Erpetoichthys calabaricus]|uniref:uncharacterized protein LOC114661931 isoform X2 n=1 Tax=Erpetoichthys calabaricus TaxID=27687 RepID=UPI0022343266|nr:uncharacterized protein LOC114661931 isoform X2 [Erpetoichthys calabaricus]
MEKYDCNQNTHAGNEETEMISGINGIPNDQLLVFFHMKKSAISLIDEPHVLLNQLRDHSFISEDIYQDIIDTTDKKKRVLAIYKFLDGLERTEPKKIRHFCEALFEDAIVRYYPKLQNLKDELLQGNRTQNQHMQIVEIQITDVRHIDNNEESTNSDHSLASSPALIIPSLTDSDEEASNSGHFNSHSQEPRASWEHSDSDTPNISRQSAGSSAVKSISYKRSVFDDEEESSGFHSCSRDHEISPVSQQSDSETPNVSRQSLRSSVAKRIKLKFSADSESDDEARNSGDDLKEQPERFCRVFDSDSDSDSVSDTPAIGKHSLRSSAVKCSASKRSGGHLKENHDIVKDTTDEFLKKDEIPVICKKTKGILSKSRMATEGSYCIRSRNKWMFCSEFEILSGREKNKKWKESIYIDMDELKKNLRSASGGLVKRRMTLGDLIKEQGLTCEKQELRQSFIEENLPLFSE